MKLHQYPICCVNLFIDQHALDLGTIHFITKTHRKDNKRSMCQKDTQKKFFIANINIKSGWTSPGCSNSATVSITGIQPENDGLRRWVLRWSEKVHVPNIPKHQPFSSQSIYGCAESWCSLWIYGFQALSVCLQTGWYLSWYSFPAIAVNSNVYFCHVIFFLQH